MKKTIAAILVLCSLAFAAPIQKQDNPDFTAMEQIVRVATEDMSRFDVYGHISRFEGNIVSTAAKMSAFHKQLNAHQQWTQADIAAALAAAGAKFGPDKEKEFRATLPGSLKMLEKAFGPMRVNKVLSMKPSFLTLPSKERSLFGWPAYWKVSTILLQNRKERLVLYFDPFEGQLQSLFVSQGSTILDPKTHKPKWKPPDD